MSVVVDKPGRDDKAGGIDCAPRRPINYADGRDAIPLDGNVAAKSGHPRAIDNSAALDH
jgi:hypothetical protein